MNPYQHFVAELERLMREGRDWPLAPATIAPVPRPPSRPDAPVALLFSPHPDDEVLMGGLALRLMREAGWRVVNVGVTLGSRHARRAARAEELRASCGYLGFELVLAAPNGLEHINLEARRGGAPGWAASVRRIADIIAQQAPALVFFPHAEDVNSTHVGTHQLVVDALTLLGPGFRTRTVQTEFWGSLRAPNLLLELGADEVAALVTALTFHVGEVQRNRYHLSLPAWLIDNVRRGSELVLGQGALGCPFTFGIPYRLALWERGAFARPSPGRALSLRDDVAAAFH